MCSHKSSKGTIQIKFIAYLSFMTEILIKGYRLKRTYFEGCPGENTLARSQLFVPDQQYTKSDWRWNFDSIIPWGDAHYSGLDVLAIRIWISSSKR
jgi:hypothetical protein